MNHKRVYSRILVKVCFAIAMGLLKTRLKNGFVYLKTIQSLDFLHHLPTSNSHKIPSVRTVVVKF